MDNVNCFFFIIYADSNAIVKTMADYDVEKAIQDLNKKLKSVYDVDELNDILVRISNMQKTVEQSDGNERKKQITQDYLDMCEGQARERLAHLQAEFPDNLTNKSETSTEEGESDSESNSDSDSNTGDSEEEKEELY